MESEPTTTSRSTQTEEPEVLAKHKPSVYEKVDNEKRCELIRIVGFGFV